MTVAVVVERFVGHAPPSGSGPSSTTKVTVVVPGAVHKNCMGPTGPRPRPAPVSPRRSSSRRTRRSGCSSSRCIRGCSGSDPSRWPSRGPTRRRHVSLPLLPLDSEVHACRSSSGRVTKRFPGPKASIPVAWRVAEHALHRDDAVGPPLFVLDGVGAPSLEQLTKLVTPVHSVAARATVRTAGFVMRANISRGLQVRAFRQNAHRAHARARLLAISRMAGACYDFLQPQPCDRIDRFPEIGFDFRAVTLPCRFDWI
jgi:hypothetical protein